MLRLQYCERFFFSIVTSTLKALDVILEPITFPIDDLEKLKEIELGFAPLSDNFIRGTVAAGDGIVFEIEQPSVKDDVISFFTRKGYYARSDS